MGPVVANVVWLQPPEIKGVHEVLLLTKVVTGCSIYRIISLHIQTFMTLL